jgi:4'-phosphopantetheinyl transferase
VRVAVDVWRIDLAGAPAPSAGELELLNDAERLRHASYLVPEPARTFATTRIALRRLLSQRQGCPPAQLQIASDGHGKPFVLGAPRLFFNVSHGDDLALIAICDGFPVGVDVETGGQQLRDPRFAAMVCSSSELSWWRRNEARDASALLRLWVRKEAVLKALGVGLADAVSGLDLGDPAATKGIHVVDGTMRVSWCDLNLQQEAIGALGIAVAEDSDIDVSLRSCAS